MSGALHLLRKDLRLLLRGSGTPGDPDRLPAGRRGARHDRAAKRGAPPAIAFVNLDTSNRTVRVGDRRLGVADYEQRLARDVDVKRLDPAAAAAALDDGRVSAVLTLPARLHP